MLQEGYPEPHALTAARRGHVLRGVRRPATPAAAGALGGRVQLPGERLRARRYHRLLDLELVVRPSVHGTRGPA